jgi:type III pantothenate kinase
MPPRAESRAAVLTLTLGNTTVSAALMSGGRARRHWSAPAQPSVARAFAAWARAAAPGVTRAAMACVAPDLRAPFFAALRHSCAGAIELDARAPLGFPLSVPHPTTIGADRLAAMAGAAALTSPPFLVLDAGTAMTFNAVVPGRGYIGGAIAPGPALFLRYLGERTAQLPLLPPTTAPAAAPGRTTRAAMRLGAEAGFEGMVRSILARLVGAEPALARAPVFVTGGGAPAVLRALRGLPNPVMHAPRLVHAGLAAVALRMAR